MSTNSGETRVDGTVVSFKTECSCGFKTEGRYDFARDIEAALYDDDPSVVGKIENGERGCHECAARLPLGHEDWWTLTNNGIAAWFCKPECVYAYMRPEAEVDAEVDAARLRACPECGITLGSHLTSCSRSYMGREKIAQDAARLPTPRFEPLRIAGTWHVCDRQRQEYVRSGLDERQAVREAAVLNDNPARLQSLRDAARLNNTEAGRARLLTGNPLARLCSLCAKPIVPTTNPEGGQWRHVEGNPRHQASPGD